MTSHSRPPRNDICTVCGELRLKQSEQEAPTSAGEWAPVEFGKNLRARPSLDRGPGGSSALRRPAHSCGAFGPSLCSVPVCVRG